jgi:hypothetical protein
VQLSQWNDAELDRVIALLVKATSGRPSSF